MKILYPDLLYDKIEDIDLDALRQKGIKGFILDIDNTLVVPHTPADERAKAFVNKLVSAGFKACIVSNNIPARAKSFADGVGLDWVCDGNKPSAKPFRLAVEKLQLKNEEIAVVGDQIFTDVWGGNRQKMITILVTPICDKENYFVKFKRILEKLVMKGYKND